MATHSSVLAWRILGTVDPGPCKGVAQSCTQLKQLSSSSRITEVYKKSQLLRKTIIKSLKIPYTGPWKN